MSASQTLDSDSVSVQPFRAATPGSWSDWGGCLPKNSFKDSSVRDSPSCGSFTNKRCKPEFYRVHSSQSPCVSRTHGRLEGPEPSQLCVGGGSGPSRVFSRPASIGSSFPLLGDQSLRRPGSIHLGCSPGHAPKEGNRTSSEKSGVLFPSFHGPQEGRLNETCHKSQTLKSIYNSPKISDGLSLHRGKNDSGWRLGHLD